MIYNQNITLDLNTNSSYVVVCAKQGDHASRTLTATLLENGELFNIPEGTAASYRIRKSNGEGAWNNADIYPQEHKVIITFTSTDLSVSGRSFADIVLTFGGARIATTSFIIDVQAAPNIINDALRSDAFGYLYSVVDQANYTIESAQAWAEGKRSTEDVLGDYYSIYAPSTLTVTLNFDTFKQNAIPSTIGKLTDYVFSYTANGWEYQYNTTIIDLTQWGFTISGTPSISDIIRVTASFADPAWHNNAKWYADALKNVSVGIVSTREPGRQAAVVGHYNSENNSYVFDFDVPSVKPHAAATVTSLLPGSTPSVNVTVTDDPDEAVGPEQLGILQKKFNFDFLLPGVQDAGFANEMAAEVTTLVSGQNATAEVEVLDSPNTAKQFNFKFGIPRGATGATGAAGHDGMTGDKGQDGVGIASVQWTSDNRIRIILTNGSSFYTPSLIGPQGRSGITTHATSFAIGNIVIDSEPDVNIRIGNNNQVLFDFSLPNVITCSDASDGDFVISYSAEETVEAIEPINPLDDQYV